MNINKGLLLVGFTAISCLLATVSYRVGYDLGAGRGIDVTLDTVNSICARQLKDTSGSVTRLGMVVKQDTISYLLSTKTIKR